MSPPLHAGHVSATSADPVSGPLSRLRDSLILLLPPALSPGRRSPPPLFCWGNSNRKSTKLQRGTFYPGEFWLEWLQTETFESDQKRSGLRGFLVWAVFVSVLLIPLLTPGSKAGRGMASLMATASHPRASWLRVSDLLCVYVESVTNNPCEEDTILHCPLVFSL